jgi:hypothetical protein
MPVIKRRGGYSWGQKGTIVRTRKKAESIGRAIEMAKMKKKKTKRRGGK